MKSSTDTGCSIPQKQNIQQIGRANSMLPTLFVRITEIRMGRRSTRTANDVKPFSGRKNDGLHHIDTLPRFRKARRCCSTRIPRKIMTGFTYRPKYLWVSPENLKIEKSNDMSERYWNSTILSDFYCEEKTNSLLRQIIPFRYFLKEQNK